jgi:hypothetical protein
MHVYAFTTCTVPSFKPFYICDHNFEHNQTFIFTHFLICQPNAYKVLYTRLSMQELCCWYYGNYQIKLQSIPFMNKYIHFNTHILVTNTKAVYSTAVLLSTLNDTVIQNIRLVQQTRSDRIK